MSELIIENDEFIVNWVIDRNPDYNILNNINIGDGIGVNNNYFSLININHNYNNHFTYVINNIIDTAANQLYETEDFIPFTPSIQPVEINFVLETLTILSNDDLNCCVCMETKENPQICQLNCQHKFCSECIFRHINRNRNYTECPLCRTQITSVTVQTNDDLENLRNI